MDIARVVKARRTVHGELFALWLKLPSLQDCKTIIVFWRCQVEGLERK